MKSNDSVATRWLKNIVHHVKRNKLGKAIYTMLEKFGLKELVYMIEAIYNNRYPTEFMKESRLYFEENKNRVEKIVDFLEDDKSRSVFLSMIEYRKNSCWRELPEIENSKTIYFDNPFFQYSNGEKLIDCGAYDGDTIIAFQKEMDREAITDYEVIAFEPDDCNYEKLKKRSPDTFAIKAGVWNRDGVVAFDDKKDSSSRINQESGTIDGAKTINVKRIDGCKICDKATLIKMDIEGAELFALEGAKELIQKELPKLAICIYHSNEDMVRIPEWVHSVVPEYRIYIRQYAKSMFETVLYATV